MANLQLAHTKYTDAEITNYIRKPAAFGNNKMPPYAEIIKNEEDLKLLVEYVRFLGEKSLKKSK